MTDTMSIAILIRQVAIMLVLFGVSLYSFLFDHLSFPDTFKTMRRSLGYHPLILFSSELLIVHVSIPYNKMVSMNNLENSYLQCFG